MIEKTKQRLAEWLKTDAGIKANQDYTNTRQQREQNCRNRTLAEKILVLGKDVEAVKVSPWFSNHEGTAYIPKGQEPEKGQYARYDAVYAPFDLLIMAKGLEEFEFSGCTTLQWDNWDLVCPDDDTARIKPIGIQHPDGSIELAWKFACGWA